MDDESIEIPQYFVCPISLQIMKDPVTAVTGITYDRDSIESWLAKSKTTLTCPVTKQPLPRDSALTPNHTLRRLIQAWCITNAENGVDRIPTPKAPLEGARVARLVRDLKSDHLCLRTLKQLEELGSENERNRRCMAEAGVAKAMVQLIIKFALEKRTDGLGECLRILNWTWSSSCQGLKLLVQENYDLVDSLSWILRLDMERNSNVPIKTDAATTLKRVVEVGTVALLDGLKPETFKSIVNAMREIRISQPGIKSALQVLIETCPWARNRSKIIEAGAVFELIDLELDKPEKRVSELIFNLLAQLCSFADGRAQFLRHAGGIAMLAKRTLRVSPAVDDRTVHILATISQFSASKGVLMEMLRVGAVSKLCMVLQADCPSPLKSKARSVLRRHSQVWNDSPCIAVYLLTRHPAR